MAIGPDIVGDIIGNGEIEHFSENDTDSGFDSDLESDLGSELGSDSGSESDTEESMSQDISIKDEEPVQKEPVEEDEYAGLTPEEREEREREEYLWRYRILHKKYQGKNTSVPIPTFNEFTELKTIKRNYDVTLRELYLDDTVETYRSYIVNGSFMLEFVAVFFMDVDMGGLGLHQTKMISNYNSLLIELGDKNYNNVSSRIPVEIRLLGMILFNAGMFFIAKVIGNRYGEDVADMIRGATGQPPPPVEKDKIEQAPKPPVKKMRGPKINFDDDINDES